MNVFILIFVVLLYLIDLELLFERKIFSVDWVMLEFVELWFELFFLLEFWDIFSFLIINVIFCYFVNIIVY